MSLQLPITTSFNLNRYQPLQLKRIRTTSFIFNHVNGKVRVPVPRPRMPPSSGWFHKSENGPFVLSEALKDHELIDYYFCWSCLIGHQHRTGLYATPTALQNHIDNKFYAEKRRRSKHPLKKEELGKIETHYCVPGKAIREGPEYDPVKVPRRDQKIHRGHVCKHCVNTFLDKPALDNHLEICPKKNNIGGISLL